MDIVEFFNTANRLCKNQRCKKCPVCKEGVCMVMRMVMLYEETVSKVEQWAKDHPVNTRRSEVLKIFPDAEIDSGVIRFCPMLFLPEEARNAYCEKHENCKECRKDYWLTEVPDND